ncbi:hydrogenase maturation nickel metallochaperone HypA [Geomonas sp. RF6]|uniref:hydrogenase maturation nickel metallochaperone HypA n=1 Tax=Geomonas sp. RF6 TaxID=2897342 RepID=UPI001E3423E0|nr:hydrogenase maturation nickel metallochaperone HypA [Geomonas sp. RF6]UFS71883.1 hydrogenase maturation nickel metallochaperone HypA [Geomonas sp. RF6]
MHEMSITQGIVEICQQNAGGRKVTEVTLEVGALSGVIPDAVEFCFAACTSGTLLEGARLVIEEIPGRGHCGSCNATFGIRNYYDPCPSCGSFGVSIVSGEELRVKELEVE